LLPYFYGARFSHTANHELGEWLLPAFRNPRSIAAMRLLRASEGHGGTRAQERSMFKYETANQKEVRRFRIAQFNGRPATVKSGGATVTGLVRAVQEIEASDPPRWTITIVPTPPREKTTMLRAASNAGLGWSQDVTR
jgi:hypothetical protein